MQSLIVSFLVPTPSLAGNAAMPLKQFPIWFAFLFLTGLPGLAGGHSYQVGDIKIIHPWAMPAASATTGRNGVGYLVLRNTGRQSDQLLAAFTAMADQVELHAYSNPDSGKPISQPVNAIEIPAGGEVRLQPGGSHLMLVSLKQALLEGHHFPIVLHFERAGKITVEMFVQPNAKAAIY